MDNFEFKLRIATNREQSKRLLSLGLKPETADCHIEITPTGIDNIRDTISFPRTKCKKLKL